MTKNLNDLACWSLSPVMSVRPHVVHAVIFVRELFRIHLTYNAIICHVSILAMILLFACDSLTVRLRLKTIDSKNQLQL